MDIMMIGSLNTYTQNMKMQMKWEKKKASGDYTSDGTMSIDDWLKKQTEGTEKTMDKESRQTMATIELKMNSGKRLTSAEMEFLRKNAPETYKKAKAIETERKAYEQRLKSCKTKEEVQRVKASQMAASLDRVNEVKNNPNIPSGKKLELIKQELRLTNASADTMTKFVQSGENSKLPTEAEQRKAEKDRQEAKEAEQKKEKPDTVEQETKESQKSETEETDSDKAERPEGSATGDVASELSADGKIAVQPRTDQKTTQINEDKPADAELKKAEKIITKTKSRIDAELTPEARKVRQAKARAAYAKSTFSGDTTAILDVKK